jgi:hypothetical protein
VAAPYISSMTIKPGEIIGELVTGDIPASEVAEASRAPEVGDALQTLLRPFPAELMKAYDGPGSRECKERRCGADRAGVGIALTSCHPVPRNLPQD